jgi:DNA-binding GntR family transcriptional regulator
VADPGIVITLAERPSLTDDVYEAIKRYIMDNVAPPETRLSIDQFARDLRVSSTPIREALVRLEAEGLARRERMRGYTTAPMLTDAQVAELFEFRGVIEPWAAAKAAQRHEEAGIAKLFAELDSIGALPAGDSYESYAELAGHDDRFHKLICELAGNAQLSQAFERTHCHTHLFRRRYSTRLGTATIAEHRDIAEAVAAGSPAAARTAMTAHLKRARKRLS